MVQMTFPNGTVIDFEDASDSDIEGAIGVLRTEQPELFKESKPLDLGTASLEENTISYGFIWAPGTRLYAHG